jgi:hypothetical protein
MNLLLETYVMYKKSKLLEWIGKKLKHTDEPNLRLKLLSLRQMIFNTKEFTLSLIKQYEDRYDEILRTTF